LFVQVTVPPSLTCTVAGENAKLVILTEAAATGAPPALEVGFEELFELLPQPGNKKRPQTTTRAKEMILVFIKSVFSVLCIQSSRTHTQKGCPGVKNFKNFKTYKGLKLRKSLILFISPGYLPYRNIHFGASVLYHQP